MKLKRLVSQTIQNTASVPRTGPGSQVPSAPAAAGSCSTDTATTIDASAELHAEPHTGWQGSEVVDQAQDRDQPGRRQGNQQPGRSTPGDDQAGPREEQGHDHADSTQARLRARVGAPVVRPIEQGAPEREVAHEYER